MNKDKLGGIGASEIGALFVRGGVKSKTAQSLALKKAKEILTGERELITTPAMTHGILNEFEAFEKCVQPHHIDANLQSTESFFLKEGLWATPDVVCDNKVIDIKCPFHIHSYHNNINKIKKHYEYQVNMQMMASGKDEGYLCFYLTAPIDENGYKEEYNIPLHKRTKTIKVDKLDLFSKELFNRFDEFKKVRDLIYTDIMIAEDVNDEILNDLHVSNKVTELKNKSNLTTWGGQLVSNKNKIYVIE